MLFSIARETQCLGDYAVMMWDAISKLVAIKFQQEIKRKRRMSKEEIAKIITKTSDEIWMREEESD